MLIFRDSTYKTSNDHTGEKTRQINLWFYNWFWPPYLVPCVTYDHFTEASSRFICDNTLKNEYDRLQSYLRYIVSIHCCHRIMIVVRWHFRETIVIDIARIFCWDFRIFVKLLWTIGRSHVLLSCCYLHWRRHKGRRLLYI